MSTDGIAVPPGGGRQLAYWLFAAACSIAAVWAARATDNSIGTIPAVWAIGAVNVAWAAIAWIGRSTPRPVVLLATVVASMAIFVVVSLVMGADADALPALAVGNIVSAAVTIALYKTYVRGPRFAPVRPTELLALFLAALAGAAVALPIGGTEHVDLGSPVKTMLWWVLHSGAYTFIGAASVTLLFYRNPIPELTSTRARDAYAQLVLAGLAFWAIIAWPGLPITWLILVPALWAGMTLGLWASAAFSLTMGMTGILVSAAPISLGGTAGDPIPARIILDMMMVTFVCVVLVLSMVRDHSAHLLAAVTDSQEQAAGQSGLLTLLFESMSEGMVLINDRHEVEIVNHAAQQFPIDELLASAPESMLGGDDDVHTVHLPAADDRSATRTVIAHSAPLAYGGEQKVALILRDMTAEQQHIDDLANFAGVAAHDLKSPLVAIQGWLELAEEAIGNDPEVARTAMRRGQSATLRMSREIDAWLSYSVASEGEVRPEVVHLDELLADITGTYPAAEFVVDAEHPVQSDRVLTRQLLVNLIGNAVKYTAPGHDPHVSVRTHPDTEPGWVRVEVADRGIGIPPGQEASIFDPFYRAVRSGTYDGAGLGLALCKRIVQRHGGTISARSNGETIKGTTVTFTLPAVDPA